MAAELSTLAERLASARRRLRFTQGYIAEQVGISQAMYSDLELGRAKGSTRIASLARVLRVDAYWLETGEGDPGLGRAGVAEQHPEYGALNNERAALLAAFERLSPLKRRALLDLIRPELGDGRHP